jgi:hypothetical protein
LYMGSQAKTAAEKAAADAEEAAKKKKWAASLWGHPWIRVMK